MANGSSTRWCPTTEQVMILEEIYKGGVRNPNASQIQQITSHLSTFGRIEGKNVFYWFQNHKARDRQKLRRKLLRQQQQQQQNHCLEQQRQQEPMTKTSAFFLPHQNPRHFLCQGCLEEATQVMNFASKLDALEMKYTDQSTMTYGHDRMMKMDVGSDQCYRPLKTLELFPIKSTGINEERN
ncbi:hypothetical protein AAC387_Pa09g1778 [Persea americana]